METGSTPFLTIGIASYNYKQYLNKAFEQIKKQTFTDYEILYCDDGSDDGSVEFIEDLIKDYPEMRIRLIKGNHEGLLANKNRIIDNALGKYIMICDADDYMLDDCLDTLCKRAADTDADVVIGGFEEHYNHGEEIRYTIPSTRSSKWIYIWHHGRIFKKDIAIRNNIRFDFTPDDICLNQRISQYSTRVEFVNKAVYVWNRHVSSASVKVNPDDVWSPISLMGKILPLMQNIMSDDRLSSSDINGIRYFMYKWYLLNVTDISLLPIEDSGGFIKQLKEIRKLYFKDYPSLSCLISALSINDSAKARISVALCWMIERLGLARIMVLLRYRQVQKRKD